MSLNENIISVQTTFAPGESDKVIEINNIKYKKYYIYSPSVSSFFNINNITAELNNNTISCIKRGILRDGEYFSTYWNANLPEGFDYYQPKIENRLDIDHEMYPVIDDFENLKIMTIEEIRDTRTLGLNQAENNLLNFVNNYSLSLTNEPGIGVNVPNPIYDDPDYGNISKTNPYLYRKPCFISPVIKNSTDRYLVFTRNFDISRVAGVLFFEYDDNLKPCRNRMGWLKNNGTDEYIAGGQYNYTGLDNTFFESLLTTRFNSYSVFPRANFRFVIFLNNVAIFTVNELISKYFSVNLSPFKITDNIFNLMIHKYNITKDELELKPITSANQLTPNSLVSEYFRCTLKTNLLLPSFSSFQDTIKLKVSTGPFNFGALKSGWLFDNKQIPPGGLNASILSTVGLNGSLSSYDNFSFMIRFNDDRAVSLEVFQKNFIDSVEFETHLNIVSGFSNTFDYFIPVRDENSFVTYPFSFDTLFALKKNIRVSPDVRVRVHQINRFSYVSTNNSKQNFSNLAQRTITINSLRTFKPTGTVYPSFYLKFPQPIFSIFSCFNMLRILKDPGNVTTISPVFLSDTEMMFYGLDSATTYRFDFDYIDDERGNFLKDLRINIIYYKGIQSYRIVRTTTLNYDTYSNFQPYYAETFFIVEFIGLKKSQVSDVNLFLDITKRRNYIWSQISIPAGQIYAYIDLPYQLNNQQLVLFNVGSRTLIDYENVINYGDVSVYKFPLNGLSGTFYISAARYDYLFQDGGNYIYSYTDVPKVTSITEDGWYSGVSAIEYFINELKKVTLLTDIKFNEFTNHITINNTLLENILIEFPKKLNSFQESGTTIYGFDQESTIIERGKIFKLPFETDLYFDSRFSQIKINLLNFSNLGYLTESLCLIKIIAKDKKGTLSINQLDGYVRMLPPGIVLSNLKFSVTDNKNLKINVNESIDLEFLIKCINVS